MSESYLGELRIFPFNFAPKGWAQCNGQLLPINQNQALYAVLGNTYGGTPPTTFALPNLQSRVALHAGNYSGQPTYATGQTGGIADVPLTLSQLPAHSHAVNGSTAASTTNAPGAAVLPGVQTANAYVTGTPATAPMNTAAILNTVSSGQPHQNRQPSLALNICISLVGIYPSSS